MEKPRLEVVIVPDEGAVLYQGRRGPAFVEDQPVYQRPQMASPISPLEWESPRQLHRDLVASSMAWPPVQPRPTKPQEKPPRRAPYDPNDFTSDELDPALEWPKESPPARKLPSHVPDGAEVVLLQSILGQFPLGLRLEKLVAMMWKAHKVHLWRLSVERGYGDILRFLEEVPGVRLTVAKGGSRYLVQMV